jgi:hypothetical protein
MMLASSNGVWSAPKRVVPSDQPAERMQPRYGMPAAVIDTTGQLRLFWSADHGDRSRIVQSVLSGTSWSAPSDVSSSGVSTFRDEAPAAASSGGSLWIFWHSNRDGIPRIYASEQTGAGWGTPFPVTSSRSAEKDPAPFVAAGALRLFFRTQRGGEVFRSRTVDFNNVDEIKRGRVADRWHYSYSTTGTETAFSARDAVIIDTSTAGTQRTFYARDAVGIYMTPEDTGFSADHRSEIDRVQALVEPFRPIPARFVWFLEPPVVAEIVYSPQADIGESYSDVYPIVDTFGTVTESTSAALPDWVVIHANAPGNVSIDPGDHGTFRNRTFFPAPS